MTAPTRGRHDHDHENWFKVARRLFDSSTWMRTDGDTIKVLLFLMERSQDPLAVDPGWVGMSAEIIAMRCGLDVETTQRALDDLCGDDKKSHHNGQPTLRAEHGGYRLLAFDDYHPGQAQRVVTKRAKRSLAGRRSIAIQKNAGQCAVEDCFSMHAFAIKGRVVCPAHMTAEEREKVFFGLDLEAAEALAEEVTTDDAKAVGKAIRGRNSKPKAKPKPAPKDDDEPPLCACGNPAPREGACNGCAVLSTPPAPEPVGDPDDPEIDALFS